MTNLGILFGFKYFNFFNDTLRSIFNYFNIFYGIPAFKALLPVGISFYTFQTLSYTIDVYRGKRKAEKHLGIFALYVAFFPQLVAGPIERSTRLLPQFYKNFDFDSDRVTDGLKLMLLGFFKKIVIADRLALLVDQVYNNPTEYHGVNFIIATVFFAFQIYCDFSGYSDIAIGGAKVMGFTLMDNFKRPYLSETVSEFWKRWHISLSSWFKDYLYIPLGGNRVVKWQWLVNVLVVFLVSGLWHGANWTFVVWGVLHGFYFIAGNLTANIKQQLGHRLRKLLSMSGLGTSLPIFKLINIGVTFTLVCFAWIFFRANTLSDAFYIVTHLFDGVGEWLLKVIHWERGQGLVKPLLAGQSRPDFIINAFLLGIIGLQDVFTEFHSTRQTIFNPPAILRWAVYLIMVLSVMNLGVTSEVPFIYFQF